MTYAFTTESVEYIRHGSTPYMVKLYKPSGDGPFPMVMDVHGGAWCNGDLADCDPRDQVLAASGFVVAASISVTAPTAIRRRCRTSTIASAG